MPSKLLFDCGAVLIRNGDGRHADFARKNGMEPREDGRFSLAVFATGRAPGSSGPSRPVMPDGSRPACLFGCPCHRSSGHHAQLVYWGDGSEDDAGGSITGHLVSCFPQELALIAAPPDVGEVFAGPFTVFCRHPVLQPEWGFYTVDRPSAKAAGDEAAARLPTDLAEGEAVTERDLASILDEMEIEVFAGAHAEKPDVQPDWKFDGGWTLVGTLDTGGTASATVHTRPAPPRRFRPVVVS